MFCTILATPHLPLSSASTIKTTVFGVGMHPWKAGKGVSCFWPFRINHYHYIWCWDLRDSEALVPKLIVILCTGSNRQRTVGSADWYIWYLPSILYLITVRYIRSIACLSDSQLTRLVYVVSRRVSMKFTLVKPTLQQFTYTSYFLHFHAEGPHSFLHLCLQPSIPVILNDYSNFL